MAPITPATKAPLSLEPSQFCLSGTIPELPRPGEASKCLRWTTFYSVNRSRGFVDSLRAEQELCLPVPGAKPAESRTNGAFFTNKKSKTPRDELRNSGSKQVSQVVRRFLPPAPLEPTPTRLGKRKPGTEFSQGPGELSAERTQIHPARLQGARLGPYGRGGREGAARTQHARWDTHRRGTQTANDNPLRSPAAGSRLPGKDRHLPSHMTAFSRAVGPVLPARPRPVPPIALRHAPVTPPP